MMKDHADAYSPQAHFQVDAKLLREQITSGARTVLLVLLAASGLVFIIACSNVANLILARSVRREGELAIRAALGASAGALRRTLLAESLILCVAGATLGVISARRSSLYLRVTPRASPSARWNCRWTPACFGLERVWRWSQRFFLAFVPRLPSANASQGSNLASGSVRITGGTNPPPAASLPFTQIAASFILLAGASIAALRRFFRSRRRRPGSTHATCWQSTSPTVSYGKTPEQVRFYKESIRRIEALPGVTQDRLRPGCSLARCGSFGPGLQFSADGHVARPARKILAPRCVLSPPVFLPRWAFLLSPARDFNALDGEKGKEPVVLSSVKPWLKKCFQPRPHNRHVYWTDPVMKFIPGISVAPHRIIGVTADIDDEHIVPGPILTVYIPWKKVPCLAAASSSTPAQILIALVTPVTQLIVACRSTNR